jgi:hypothetical protein
MLEWIAWEHESILFLINIYFTYTSFRVCHVTALSHYEISIGYIRSNDSSVFEKTHYVRMKEGITYLIN